MSGEQPEPEPVVGANGETFIPGTGKFANYYKPESGGPWYELRDGAMVKADFRRGPKWWRRLHWFWKVLIVIAAFSWGIWLVVFGVSFIAGFATSEEPMPTETPFEEMTESQQVDELVEYYEANMTLSLKVEWCSGLATIEKTSGWIYRLAEALQDNNTPRLSDAEALASARAMAIMCSR